MLSKLSAVDGTAAIKCNSTKIIFISRQRINERDSKLHVTCEWEEWSTNPLKQKGIDFYGMRELVQRP